jgi:hypothetical protein
MAAIFLDSRGSRWVTVLGPECPAREHAPAMAACRACGFE